MPEPITGGFILTQPLLPVSQRRCCKNRNFLLLLCVLFCLGLALLLRVSLLQEPAVFLVHKGKPKRARQEVTITDDADWWNETSQDNVPQKQTKSARKEKWDALFGNATDEEGDDEKWLSADEYRKKFDITAPLSGEPLPDPVQGFRNFPFNRKLRILLRWAGFTAPTPIQAQSWPIINNGHDLVAVAKTGSGKTLGYLLPAFRLVDVERSQGRAKKGFNPMALVLAPTRELCMQIHAQSKNFGNTSGINAQAFYGGEPKRDQIYHMKRFGVPHMALATPGRLQDLVSINRLNLSHVRYVVLDEADRMLDMGFEPEIRKILAMVPEERQTLLFTATWPQAVQSIAQQFLRNGSMHIVVGEEDKKGNLANLAITQEFRQVGEKEKQEELNKILGEIPATAKVIVFVNTKRRTEFLSLSFATAGVRVATIHGDKAQKDRDLELRKFVSNKARILLATDVCARGLDIQDVTHVINYDIPHDGTEAYIHRIGRTGRAGKTGTAITFWDKDVDKNNVVGLATFAKEAGQQVPEWLREAVQKRIKKKKLEEKMQDQRKGAGRRGHLLGESVPKHVVKTKKARGFREKTGKLGGGGKTKVRGPDGKRQKKTKAEGKSGSGGK